MLRQTGRGKLQQWRFWRVYSKWKYKHYFIPLEVKAKDGRVKCTLCPSAQCLSTSTVSNPTLMKHLSTAHSSTELVAKNTIVDNNKSRPGVASLTKEDMKPRSPNN
ncbi:hypothetical protein ILYODFUR_034903 [Ilyodon furcidens]|uniref:BED-type domain-containing protein n=1 Tax=Ilyodon furcidens TaxID=33524 RepID=A0ABV0TGL0_9TELE